MRVSRERDDLVVRVDHAMRGRECGQVLTEALHMRPSDLHAAFSGGLVRVGRRPAVSADLLSAGDTVRVKVAGGPIADGRSGQEPEPIEGELDVCFEDDHVLVVNKRAHVIMYPGDEGTVPTLANAVAWHYAVTEQDSYVRPVHRLDRDTTGVCVYAKHALALRLLSAQLESRELTREYLALVRGRPLSEQGKIDKPLGRDRHVAGRMRIHSGGMAASTLYRVLWTNGQYSLLLCELLTGRTHQIRVHLASAGLPILGDVQYGAPSPLISRQALHAVRVRFANVFGAEPIEVSAPIAQDLQAAAESVGLGFDALISIGNR